MAPWTQDRLDRLARLVTGLLECPDMMQVSDLMTALREQQDLLEWCYRILGQQAERLQALEAENEALKAIVLDQDAPRPWDDPDDRPW